MRIAKMVIAIVPVKVNLYGEVGWGRFFANGLVHQRKGLAWIKRGAVFSRVIEFQVGRSRHVFER